MMRDHVDQKEEGTRVTVRLPEELSRVLNALAEQRQITLSQCIRERLAETVHDAVKMPAIQRASLQAIAELLYYSRLSMGTGNAALVSEAKQHAENFVKKVVEGKK